MFTKLTNVMAASLFGVIALGAGEAAQASGGASALISRLRTSLSANP